MREVLTVDVVCHADVGGKMSTGSLPEWRSIPCIGPAKELFVPGEWLEQGDWASVRERLRAIAG